MAEMNIREKLAHIQNELKAPKNQFNSFGNYKYRNCEDILENAKPICLKYGTSLVIKDEIVLVGDRYYVKAIATLYDVESDDSIEASAYARESVSKKGMDDSQVTGATSSYARKYALNGLFNIDDTKDFDHESMQQNNDGKKKKKQDEKNLMEIVKVKIVEAEQLGVNFEDEKVIKYIQKYNGGKYKVEEMTEEELKKYIAVVNTLIQGKKEKTKD